MSLFDKFHKKRSVSRKMGWEVYPASKRATGWKEFGIGKKKLSWGGKRTGQCFYTKDPGLAKKIEQTLGNEGTKDVIVCEVDNPGAETPRKSFIINAPWKRERK